MLGKYEILESMQLNINCGKMDDAIGIWEKMRSLTDELPSVVAYTNMIKVTYTMMMKT